MKELYPLIFKRKSFHLFRNNKTKEYHKDFNTITNLELDEIYAKFQTITPLIKDIKVDIKIVKEFETNSKRGAEYAILFYSEKKENYLQNIGFIGEILDLYLVDKNIGTLWYGVGKTKDTKYNGLEFVTMMLICKVPKDSFRKDMFASKRKEVSKMWSGSKYLDIANIVRFAPSSCNTQPWKVLEKANILEVYRFKKEGKRGIMPEGRVIYQNLIDIGIFFCFTLIVLDHFNIPYKYKVLPDSEDNKDELSLDFEIEIIE